MFNKYIPRGIIYHQLSSNFLNIFKVLFSRLNDEKEVEKFENAFAEYNGSQFCVAFPFARMGIYHSLETLNIPKGSENYYASNNNKSDIGCNYDVWSKTKIC